MKTGFYLRTPYDSSCVLCVDKVKKVYISNRLIYIQGARPASNLNLSSVLFASAASAATSSSPAKGTIAEGTAMPPVPFLS